MPLHGADPTSVVTADDTLGPWAGYAVRGGFDFTLRFEESILAIPLCCLFLAVLSVRIWQLVTTDSKVKPAPLRWWKTAANITLAALNAALIAQADKFAVSVDRARSSLSAASLAFVVSLGICVLSWLEHHRTFRPSAVLGVFLFFSVLLDLPRTRTLWLSDTDRVVPAIFTATMMVRTVMLVLESVSKRTMLLVSYENLSPEYTHGIFSVVFFAWLAPLFKIGSKRDIRLNDINEFALDMQSHTIHEPLSHAWSQVEDKVSQGALFMTVLRVHAWSIATAALPRLCKIGLKYSQPFLVNKAVLVAATPKTGVFNNWGYGLIGAFALVYGGIAVVDGQYSWFLVRAESKIKATMGGLIYQEMLSVELSSPDFDISGALTLAATDTDTVATIPVHIHDTWSSIVEIAIAVYLLYRQLGQDVQCLLLFRLVSSSLSILRIGRPADHSHTYAVLLLVAIVIAIPMGQSSAQWIQASQVRVSATSKLLGNIKGLKISGLTNHAFAAIRELRNQELKVSLKYRYLLTIASGIAFFGPIWNPFLSFALFAGLSKRGGNSLTLEKGFTAFAILGLMNLPLQTLLGGLGHITAVWASFKRLQSYINKDKRDDYRKHGQPGTPVKEASTTNTAQLSHNASRIDSAGDIVASVSGSVSWDGGKLPAISVSDWKIYRNQVMMVVGPVGSGKSTLLKVLLGEVRSFRGNVHVASSGVAYCDQRAWIPNDTIRSIIVSRSEFEKEWYDTVLKACALVDDIRSWPQGDATLAGSKGLSLSGGQKHRLAIARAVYSGKEFLIFDDVLSGLDFGTQNLVFDGLFGSQGLLRTSKRTVVVASSSDRCLRYADRVLVLNSQGQVLDDALPKNLSSSNALSKVILAETHAEYEPDTKPETFNKLETDAADGLEEDLNEVRNLGDFSTYKFFATAAGRFNMFGFLFGTAAFAVCSAFPAIWLGWWAAANTLDPGGHLNKWLGVYAVIAISGFASVMVAVWFLAVPILSKSGAYLHEVLLKTTARAPLLYHTSNDKGSTVNRFSQELQLADIDLPLAMIGFGFAFFISIAMFIVTAVMSKYMVASLPLLIFLLYLLQRFYLRTSRQLRMMDIEYRGPVYSHLAETIDGLVTIRAFQWEDKFMEKHVDILDQWRKPGYAFGSLQCWLNFWLDCIILLFAVIFIALAMSLRQQIGPVKTGTGLNSVLGFVGVASELISSWVALELSIGAVERIKMFVNRTEVESDDQTLPPGMETGNWPTRGAVKMEHVAASYSKTGSYCLDNVNLSIEPGQKIAICGRTGSGKNSLTLCLLRLLNLSQGSISIDGIDIATLPPEFVRSHLVALPQDTYILDDTIRLNVDPLGNASDENIILALKGVRLWDKVVARGGLDAVIHETSFSTGESQLLVFARALVRKSKILILDEFTSSLDSEATEIIDEIICTSFRDWTIIAVVHKLQSVLDFDQVVVLHSGSVVEQGIPKELLKEEDSEFRRLYEMHPK